MKKCFNAKSQKVHVNIQLVAACASPYILVEGSSHDVKVVLQHLEKEMMRKRQVAPSEAGTLGSLVTHTTTSQMVPYSEVDCVEDLADFTPSQEPLSVSAPVGGTPQCLLPSTSVCLFDGSWALASALEVDVSLLNPYQASTPAKIKFLHKEAPRLQDMVQITILHGSHSAYLKLTKSHQLIVQRNGADLVIQAGEISPNRDSIWLISQTSSMSTVPTLASVLEVHGSTEDGKVVELVLDDDNDSFLVSLDCSELQMLAVPVFGAPRPQQYTLVIRRSGEALQAVCQELTRLSSKSDPGAACGKDSDPVFQRHVRPPHDENCTNACRYYLEGTCTNGVTCRACHHPDHALDRVRAPLRRPKKKTKKVNAADARARRPAGSPDPL